MYIVIITLNTAETTVFLLLFQLYFEARLTWKGSKLLKPFLQAIVLYLAMLCCISRISDYKHHWSDVLLGALLGILVACIVVGFDFSSFILCLECRVLTFSPKFLTGSLCDQLVQRSHSSGPHEADRTVIHWTS